MIKKIKRFFLKRYYTKKLDKTIEAIKFLDRVFRVCKIPRQQRRTFWMMYKVWSEREKENYINVIVRNLIDFKR